ncbi:MAG TPA: dTMP kinase [Pseudobacteroides sp.]|nr:dTMP kinase [Pseudobacteroides sp.]
MVRGYFITVEGTDGAGKTTQIKLIEDYLKSKNKSVVVTREPGGTNIGEKIRDILLDSQNSEMGIITEMLLYASARAQLVSEVIRPAIEEGKVVICDRFVDSSYVYQGFGRGIDLKIITDVNRVALDGLLPDITLFFDINPVDALRRRSNSSELDRIEKEKMDFHKRVYNGYKKLAMLYSDRINCIDSNRSVEEIFVDVKACIDELMDL